MKIIYLGLALSVYCSQLVSIAKPEFNLMKEHKPLYANLLTAENQPTKALKKLLDLEGIKVNNLQELVDTTQKQWLRDSTEERWKQKEKSVTNRQEYIDAFKNLGIIDKVEPREKEYDYVLIMGATAPRMQSRTMQMLKLYNSGIKFSQAVFLVGQRDRDLTIETDEVIFNPTKFKIKKGWEKPINTPQTETALAETIIDQADMPKELAAKIKVIDTPKQQCANGTLRRPNTGDTFKEWLKENPKPGKCLVISNNPYIGYMESVALTFIPKDFTIETVGPKTWDDEKIATCLDNLARWIYQENIRRK